METIIKQSADGIVLRRDNNFNTNLGKVFINNHEITDADTFFKVAEENTRLLEQVKKQKEVIDEAVEYIEWNKDKAKFDNNTKEYDNYTFLNEENINDLLDILNEALE